MTTATDEDLNVHHWLTKQICSRPRLGPVDNSTGLWRSHTPTPQILSSPKHTHTQTKNRRAGCVSNRTFFNDDWEKLALHSFHDPYSVANIFPFHFYIFFDPVHTCKTRQQMFSSLNVDWRVFDALKKSHFFLCSPWRVVMNISIRAGKPTGNVAAFI